MAKPTLKLRPSVKRSGEAPRPIVAAACSSGELPRTIIANFCFLVLFEALNPSGNVMAHGMPQALEDDARFR